MARFTTTSTLDAPRDHVWDAPADRGDVAPKGKDIGVLTAPPTKPRVRRAMRGFLADLPTPAETREPLTARA